MKTAGWIGWVAVTTLFIWSWASGITVAQKDKPKQKQRKTAEMETKKSFGEDRQVIYKKFDDGKNLKLYFFVPPNQEKPDPKPAVVFFFGGGWVGGTPEQFQPHAEYLKSRGMIAILADYRTQRSHKTSPQDCVADAKSAIRYVRLNADKLGVDPKRIVAAGGSAGGHIAAASATVTDFDDKQDNLAVSCKPNALILFNPVYDNGPGQWGHKKVKAYWQKISPAANIREGIPPAIVFLGDKDKLISVETAKAFQSKMNKVGAKSELHIYRDKGHGFFNFGRRNNQPFRDTVEKMDRFLAGLGYIKGKPSVDQFLESKKPK